MTCGLISGADQICFVTEETTFNSHVEPAGTDAIAVTRSQIMPSQERKDREDHTGGRSRQGKIRGKQGGAFELSFYVTPNSTPGNAPPQIDALLQICTAGTPTSGGGTYTFVLDASAALRSFQFVRFSGNAAAEFCEWANGCCAEAVRVEHSAGDTAIVTVSGKFAGYGKIEGTPVTSGTAIATATSVTLAAADAFLIKEGARIKFATDTGTANAGYLVTAVSDDGLTLTISPGLATGTGTGEAITAVVTYTATTPSATFTGDPIAAVSYGMTIGGVATDYLSCSLEWDTGMRLLDDEANSEFPTCIYSVPRLVDLSLSVNRKDTTSGIDGAGFKGATKAIVWRLGRDVSGERMTISLPACDITPAENQLEGADKATANFTASAQKNAAEDDEMSIFLD